MRAAYLHPVELVMNDDLRRTSNLSKWASLIISSPKTA